MAVRPQQRLSNPLLRNSELNSTHTRYDVATAAPDDHVLRIQFIILASVNLLVAMACFVVFVSILRSRTVRSNPFNFYLLFIVLPDFLSSFLCFLTCAMSAPQSTYYSETMCGFQSWYLTFAFTANCWMNGVIVHQLHKMLRCSNIRQHYQPPTRRHVFFQAGVVYIYAATLAFVGVWNIHWLPHKTKNYHGLNCFPMEYDLPSSLVYWMVFIPAFLLLPLLYAVYVAFDVYRRKLLPPMGRRRTLVLYFSRLVVIYVVMWGPFLVICTLGNIIPLGDWVYWSGAVWSHFQGFVSACLSTTKPDIKEAVRAFLYCRKERPVNIEGPERIQAESTRRTSSLLLAGGSKPWHLLSSAFGLRSLKKSRQSSSFENNTKGVKEGAGSSSNLNLPNVNGGGDGGRSDNLPFHPVAIAMPLSTELCSAEEGATNASLRLEQHHQHPRTKSRHDGNTRAGSIGMDGSIATINSDNNNDDEGIMTTTTSQSHN